MEPSTHNIRWFYDPEAKSTFQLSSLQFGRAKGFLYQASLRSVSKHDLYECYQLLKILPKETSIDPYILYRLVLILLESSPTEQVHHNAIIYLETILSSFDISKLDVFLEFLTYFIRHQRIDDARALYSLRNRYISSERHKPLPIVRVNINCYELLLNYLEWNDKEVKNKFDESIQGWIVNAIVCLNSVTSNHEYFVTCVVKVLLHYKYYKKAYIFVSQFQRNNPDNIGIQLFLHKLLEYLSKLHYESTGEVDSLAMKCDIDESELEQNRNKELERLNNFSLTMDNESFDPHQYPIDKDKESILNNLRRLDPKRKEIIEMQDSKGDLVELLKDLMDSLEFVSEMRNIEKWSRVKDILDVVKNKKDLTLLERVKSLWQQRYSKIWRKTDFVSLSKANKKGRIIIKAVVKCLRRLNAKEPQRTFIPIYLPDYCKPGYIKSEGSSDDSP